MKSKIELFRSKDNDIQLQVTLDKETVWLIRQQLSLLFDRDVKTIGKHINNIFLDNELEKKSGSRKICDNHIARNYRRKNSNKYS